MKALGLALIAGFILIQTSPPKLLSSANPEINEDDAHTMSLCCPVGPSTACEWPGNFPIGSECYCENFGKIYPGTVCGK